MAKSKLGLESLDLAEIVRLVVKSFHLDPCRSNFSHFEFDNYIVFFVKFGFNVLGLVFHHGMAPDFLPPLFFPPNLGENWSNRGKIFPLFFRWGGNFPLFQNQKKQPVW